MEQISGLRKYTDTITYKKALGIPAEAKVEYKLLAQGEYNINYVFSHPLSGQKLLLRVNCGSQMQLSDQIGYEFRALKQLERSGRTPRALWMDGSKKELDHGILVMEFLPGQVLNYKTDLSLAAECLADIHSTPIVRPDQLISPEAPLAAVLEECERMFDVYCQSQLAVSDKKLQIRRMLDRIWNKVRNCGAAGSGYKCCINTELNATNFLINGMGTGNYLIDWEKPLYGIPAQDLGHFLAPTTTFWKTDIILEPSEVQKFIALYIEAVGDRFSTAGISEETEMFLPVTCMRGITWCAMAWVQYQQPDKLIVNQSTKHKLDAYLSEEFLDDIEKRL